MAQLRRCDMTKRLSDLPLIVIAEPRSTHLAARLGDNKVIQEITET